MRVLRRGALWTGCALLTAAFVTTEELAGGSPNPAADAPAPAVTLVEPPQPTDPPAPRTYAERMGVLVLVEPDQPAAAKTARPTQPATDRSAPRQDSPSKATKSPPPPKPKPKPDPKPAPEADPKPAPKAAGRQVNRTCRVTAYCDRGLTASGTQAGVGQCAAPADIPFGSKVYIPALKRSFVVTDRTHRRFRGNTVDIFVPTEYSCRKFGRRYLRCEFTIHPDPPEYGELKLRAGG